MIGKCRACSEIAVFWKGVIDQARKGAGRDGKRYWVPRRGGHGGPPLQYVRQSTRCL